MSPDRCAPQDTEGTPKRRRPGKYTFFCDYYFPTSIEFIFNFLNHELSKIYRLKQSHCSLSDMLALALTSEPVRRI
jgi:hypothetical protein